MTQQQNRPSGAVLFDNYGINHNSEALRDKEVSQLVRYCLGIFHNPETAKSGRLEKAHRILQEQGHKVPNYLVPALRDRQHLDDIVALIGEIVVRHPDNGFIDVLARNLTGALADKAQQEGALKVLGLEQVCGAALRYAASKLRDDNLYQPVSTFFRQAARYEQHRQNVLGVLTWATEQQELAVNAAFVLNSLANEYGWKIGTQVDIVTGQLVSPSAPHG